MKRSMTALIVSTAIAASVSMPVGVSAKKVVLTYWNPFSGTYGASVAKLLHGYEASHPGITVKVVPIDQGLTIDDKLIAALAAGVGPDVYVMNRFSGGDYGAKGTFVPLDNYIKRDSYDMTDFYKWSVRQITYKGKTYGIPFDTDARELFYNKDLFRQVGLDPNLPPKTWDDLERYSDKLTLRAGSQYKRIGLIPWAGEGSWLYTWGFLNQGQFVDYEANKITANSRKVVEALTFMTNWASRSGYNDLAKFQASFAGGAQDPFLIGKLGMEVHGDWMLSYFTQYGSKVDFGVAPLPINRPGDVSTTWGCGFSHAIVRGSKHQEEAWDLIKYMSSTKAMEQYCAETSHLPTRIEVSKSFAAKQEDARHAIFVDALQDGAVLPVTPVSVDYWNALDSAKAVALSGKKSPQQAMDEVTANVQKLWSRFLARNQ